MDFSYDYLDLANVQSAFTDYIFFVQMGYVQFENFSFMLQKVKVNKINNNENSWAQDH